MLVAASMDPSRYSSGSRTSTTTTGSPASSRFLRSAGGCSGMICRASASISFSVFMWALLAPVLSFELRFSYYHHSRPEQRTRPGCCLSRDKTAIIGRGMKGLILSGGRGTRLRPITFTSAKQLVPVANKPILFYGIEALAASGIREIGIVVGDTRQEIKDAVGDGSRFGVRVTYIEQEAPLGLAHAVLVAEPFLGTDPFCMYLGDNLIRERLAPLVTRFRDEKPNCQILLASVPDPTQFGVAVLRDGQVVRLVEKPKQPPSNLGLVGVYMFDATVFKAVKAIRPSARGELEITDAIQWLIDEGYLVRPHVIEGWWKDTGKLEDMLEANRIILDTLLPRTEGTVEDSEIVGRVVIEAGARVVRSTVRGPAIIGRDAVVESAYVGPFTSIGDRVVLRASEVEHSILLEGASVTDVGGRIESSLIGRNVSIYRTASKPRSFNFMLGDRSEVGLI